MPINSPDKKERFPKEISRRLFPSSGDRKAQECLEKAILEHADVDLPKRNRDCSPFHRPSVGTESMHVPPARSNAPSEYVPPNYERDLNIGAESTAPPTFLGSSIERERAPYSNTPAEAIIDDTNPFPSAFQPLERERKPYSAVPGVGKARDDGLPGGEPRSNSITSRPGFSNSTAPSRPIPKNASGATGQRPMDMPKPEIHHHHSNARRNRSPSFSGAGNDFRRSDGDIRGFPQPFPPSSLPAVDPFEDHARRYPRDQADRARRQADDEARAYGQSPNARGKPDREMDINGPHRASYHTDEDYYRNAGRGGGSGYDYSQPYGGPVYR